MKAIFGVKAFCQLTFLALSIGATSYGSVASPIDIASDAAALVRSVGNRALEIVTDQGLTAGDRQRHFRDLLLQSFDVPSIGRAVLGRYWGVATDVERKEFLSLLEEMIVGAYTKRLGESKGEQFTVAGSTRDGERAKVTTNVIRPNATQPIKVVWRVEDIGGRAKIVDVIVEGVSMIVTQQQEFGSVVQRNGGQIPPLLTAMRERLENMSQN